MKYFTALFFLAMCPFAAAQNINQFWLAAQHDWAASRGFFFVIDAPYDAGPSKLSDAKLILAIGDGKGWQFLKADVDWKFGQTYSAKATIKDGLAQVWIDGQPAGQLPANLIPATADLSYNQQPGFLRGPSTYVVHESKLHVHSEGKPVDGEFVAATLPPQLLMFNSTPQEPHLPLKVENEVTIETEFSFAPSTNLRDLSPFVDRYGQSLQADWPDKVRSDDDLKKSASTEDEKLKQWGEPTGFDKFGGVTDSSWKEKATGFFHVAKHDDKWWLISPLGNPVFYIGICDAPALDWESTPTDGRGFLFDWLPPHDGPFAAAWVKNPWNIGGQENANYLCWQAVDMIRKFGPSWQQQASESAVRRAKVLGFSGFGKWSKPGHGVPDLPVLYHSDVPALVRHPDIFDPNIRTKFEASLRKQIEPRKDDPMLLGWSVGNEMDECIAAADIAKILTMDAPVPAKRALIDFALKEIFNGKEKALRDEWQIEAPNLYDAKPMASGKQIEQMRRFYAQQYYDFICRTVKSIDANHLYFGMWVTPNWWVNSGDWDSIAEHCDVIGYDHYANDFAAEPVASLMAKNDKPVLCGEFSFPPHYDGRRGSGRYSISSPDDNSAGEMYERWLNAAAKNPRCVGVFYFQYRDQPITGRGPNSSSDTLVAGENFAFGLVDITDRLKLDFASHVRSANLAAAKTRLGGKH